MPAFKLKMIWSLILLMLLIGIPKLTFDVQPARSDYTWTETIIIHADGTVTPSDAPISRKGDIYTLTSNIINAAPSGCVAVRIERSNTIFDGVDFTLQGKNAPGSEGIHLYEVKNITIRNIRIKQFQCGIALFASSHNIISKNNITNNTSSGIYLCSISNNNIITRNIVTNSSSGIKLDTSSNNTIVENNIVNNTYVGIELISSSHNIISKNNITNNTRSGIYLFDFSNNNIIIRNNITNNGAGIALGWSPNNTIIGNNIMNNGYVGIELTGSLSNTIIGNDIIKNFSWGIFLFKSSNSNVISGNNVTDHYYGVYLDSSSENTIYHNNFINNIEQTYVTPGYSNVFDNDYPSGGNYWSDYDGVDADGDGIGDTPYVIDASNQDNYPLIHPTYFQVLLHVPYQYQGDTSWCGPASLAMVLNYYGAIFHPWDYASSVSMLGLSEDQGTLVSDLVYFLYKNYPIFNIRIGNYTLEEIRADQNNVVLRDIKSNISSGYPVILSLVGGNIPDISRHFVVVTGYNGSGLFINDPSGAFFTDPHFLKKSGYISPYINEFVAWNDIKMFIQPYEHNPILGDHNTLLCVQSLSANPLLGTIGFGEIHWGSSKMVLDRGMLWSQTKPVTPDDKLGFYFYAYNSRSYIQYSTLSVRLVGEDDITYKQFEQDLSIDAFEGSYFYNSGTKIDLPITQYYRLFIELKDQYGNILDYFITPPIYYFKWGMSILLKEEQHHLFLHVYDTQGNHVGLNYTTNQTDLGIPGSYYYDDLNGTAIIVLPQPANLTVVVDATYAHDPIEFYSLTVNVMTDQGISSQTYNGTITSGEKQNFPTQVLDGQVVIVPEFPSFLILSLFMILTLLVTIVWRKNKGQGRMLQHLIYYVVYYGQQIGIFQGY